MFFNRWQSSLSSNSCTMHVHRIPNFHIFLQVKRRLKFHNVKIIQDNNSKYDLCIVVFTMKNSESSCNQVMVQVRIVQIIQWIDLTLHTSCSFFVMLVDFLKLNYSNFLVCLTKEEIELVGNVES